MSRITLLMIGLAFVLIALIKAIPLFVDKEQMRTAIEKGLRESMGVRFRIQELTMDSTIFQGLQVNLNTTAITDAEGHPLGDIRNITVQIRYLPLFTQQLPEIAKIHINHVTVPVGTYNLFKTWKFHFKKPERTGFLKPAEMRDTEILLTNYVISDNVLPPEIRKLLPQVREFYIRDGKISIRHLKSERPVSVLGDGNISFVPGSAQGKAPLKMGRFTVFAELPASLTEEKHRFTPSDIARLELAIAGPQMDLGVKYRHPFGKPTGEGTIQSGPVNLTHLQALALQLSDTLGFPLPEALSQVYLAGIANISDRFLIDFTKPESPEIKLVDGLARLTKVIVAQPESWPTPMLKEINGSVGMTGNRISTRDLKILVDSLPLRLQGAYNLDSGVINATISGENLRLTSLQKTLRSLGVPMEALKGRDLSGLLDFRARLTGTRQRPVYQGNLNLQRASVRDDSVGLDIRNADARFQFRGAGLKNPKISYQGLINIREGQLDHPETPVEVGEIQGQIRLEGTVSPGQKPVLPVYTGHIRVGQGRYRDPKTGLLVQGVRGVFRLAENQIRLEDFRGALDGTPFQVGGTVSPNLANPESSRYNIRLNANNVNLQRFKNEVLAKLPQAQPLLAQLQPYSGLADVDMTLATGLQLRGRVDVSALALRTGMEGYPIRVPAISLLFTNREVTVPQTTLYYGPVALRLQGVFRQPGNYRIEVASDEVPTDMLRDHQELLALLTEQTLPRIWNTAGSFAMNGLLSNRGTNLTLDFNRAGLSWQGGDFPLYDVNGRLFYRLLPGGKPLVASRNLSFRYGNSLVAVDIQNQDRFQFNTNGVLSALAINHFLVSPQSNATPYQEVPFQAAAQGLLASLPAAGGQSRNDVIAELNLDLNPNFKYKYTDSEPKPAGREGNLTAVPPGNIPEPAEAPALPDMAEGISGSAPNEERSRNNQPRFKINPWETIKDSVGWLRQRVESGIDTLIHRREAEEKEAIVGPAGEGPEARQPETTKPQPKDGGMPPPEEKAQETPKREMETRIAPLAGAKAPGELPSTALPAVAGGDDNAYLTGRLHLLGPDLLLEQANLRLFDGGNVLADGVVRNIFSPDTRNFGFHVAAIPEINLDRLSHSTRENDFFRNARGTIGGDLQLTGGNTMVESIIGWFAANRVAIPLLTLRDVTGRLDFNGRSATADVPTFSIPGVNTSLSATTDDVFEVPITLENVKIHGSLLSIASLVDFNDQIVAPIIVDQLARNFSRPWQQGDPSIPIQFRHGDLHFDEVIYENIILNNMASDFSLYANSFYELSNTTLEAGGGKANGYFSMNPRENNFMTLELNAEDISANALTRALLDVTNQIFGRLNGTVRFTTFGADNEEMLTNANGTVNMRVRDGRLPAIARVETLLATANVLRGGILGLNLNNIIRSLQVYDTNYFAELSGSMLVANRVLYTDNLLSDGINLDLFIQGSLRMDNGNADMLVNGVMSQDVAGRLGTLGSLSVGRLVRFIPALGTLGRNQPGLLEYIPGVGYIPGFGGPAGTFSRFQVRIRGPLDDPASIRDFRWVRANGADLPAGLAPTSSTETPKILSARELLNEALR
ncbi:MAG TPA: AsmA family protein [Coleofasciculaceae cyanobacterium]|jgi:hypothetical protein